MEAILERLIKAFENSMRALNRLARTEKAVQQELILLVLSVPVAWFLATSWTGFALLVGAVLFLLLIEVLNTGIEAACNAVSRDFNIDIQLAKDCGSLAVLIAILLTGSVWLLAIAGRLWGIV